MLAVMFEDIQNGEYTGYYDIKNLELIDYTSLYRIIKESELSIVVDSRKRKIVFCGIIDISENEFDEFLVKMNIQ